MLGLEAKFDSGLRRIYHAFLRMQEGQTAVSTAGELPVPVNGLINITVQYTGELDDLRPLGFSPVTDEAPGRATGTVDLADIERLVGSDQVISMRFGEPKSPFLDVSVPDVRANQVWTLTAGTFTGETGKGVLVAVIDTGIDWRHDFFLSSTAPKTTRILKIWDPGLTATGAEVTPIGAGLAGVPDYGVEYDDAHINDQLRGVVAAMPVRHRDCVGHGTHVASIAAGDGRGPFTHPGVAPEADLIVVKFLDLETHPNDPNPPNAPLPFDQIFRDAVDYVLKVADDMGRSVVLNMSFGTDLGPHDGFTADEDFLTSTFDSTVGKVCVIAAGNSGDKRQHARIEFAAAGSLDIPLEIFDDRGAKKLEYRRCTHVPGTRSAGVQVWYPTGATTLTGAVQLSGAAAFEPGPVLGNPAETGTHVSRDWEMTNATETDVLHTGAMVRRNQFEFVIEPYRNRHVLGTYILRLTSSGPLTAHLWCRGGRGEGMRVGSAGVPAQAHVEDLSLIGSDAGAANVITVAAFDAETKPAVPITTFSSRGPLVSYGAPVAQPAKPDIAAPGMSVDAAKSRSAKPWGPALITPKKGTSMSAPHVAGAVALMLQKKPTLATADALAILLAHSRTAPPTTPQEAGSGRLDVKAAFDNVPP